jgi:peptide/nickel transport system ATP-binding protein
MFNLQERLGLSFIFISHDMSVIRYFCDRVAVMYKGRIVESGKTEEVLNNPSHPYTKSLLSAVLRPDPTLRSAGRHRYFGNSAPTPLPQADNATASTLALRDRP